ncbi:hypothetical protein [Roseomonas sp. USHLN139]|uniref:hypothetical protein n=1 Tax=Roseomonas sp. USHLN139 TaxID=3081298 RepID=UPI003B0260E5
MTPAQIIGLHQAIEAMRREFPHHWLHRYAPTLDCQGAICALYRAAENAGLVADPTTPPPACVAPERAVPEPPPPAAEPRKRRPMNISQEERDARAERMRKVRRDQLAKAKDRGTITTGDPAPLAGVVAEAAPVAPTAAESLPPPKPVPAPSPQPIRATALPVTPRDIWDEADDLLAAGMSARQVAQELDLPLSKVSDRALRLRAARASNAQEAQHG